MFGSKPWVNPLGKMSNFRLFGLLVFIAQKGVFFVLEYHQRHFPGLYCLNKKVGKMGICGPKPWVNSLGKMSIFRLLWTSCFYSLQRRFFVLGYHKRHFPGLYCLKKKVGKMAIFGPKPWVNPLRKNVNFATFRTSQFLQARKAFFRSRLS